jgi:hypothetical protein
MDQILESNIRHIRTAWIEDKKTDPLLKKSKKIFVRIHQMPQPGQTKAGFKDSGSSPSNSPLHPTKT